MLICQNLLKHDSNPVNADEQLDAEQEALSSL